MTLGYTYYNRPGADLKAHNADVTACALAAGTVHSVAEVRSNSPYSYGSGWAAWRSDPTDRNLAAATLENCMVVRGWRVVQLPDAEGKSLSNLSGDKILSVLAPWISAVDPHGQIVRLWGNDAANGAVPRYNERPSRTKHGQLSLIAGAPDLQELPTSPAREPPSPWVNPRWPSKFLTPADIAGVRPDAAILMVRIKDLSMHAGVGIMFNRMGASNDSYPSMSDHAPDRLYFGKGLLFAHQEGDMFVIAVPPGRWRVYGVGSTPMLNFCLGSPAFTLNAGEVVYAGSFDLSGEQLGPDLDLAPAEAWFGAKPLPVRAADYVNGTQGPCGDNTLYAWEIKGAPFEPGYAWGSLAASTMPPSK